MSEDVAADASLPDPLRTVADAMEAAIRVTKDGAADAKATVEKVLPAASSVFSRFVYTTCYTLAYGIVFPTVLIARSIPRNNSVVHGLVDGAQAAIDTVDQLKSRQFALHLAKSRAALPSPS